MAYDSNLVLLDPTRRLSLAPEQDSARVFLLPAQFEAILAAATALDNRVSAHGGPDYRDLDRAGIITVLALAMPRVSELCALRWRDVTLDSGVFRIVKTKTGEPRTVRMVPAVREVFRRRAELTGAPPDGFVWPTASGSPRTRHSIRQRILGPVHAEAAKHATLPPRITPHAYRRTGLTWMAWAGKSQRAAMQQAGHTTARLTLEVYQQNMPDDPVAQARAAYWLGD